MRAQKFVVWIVNAKFFVQDILVMPTSKFAFKSVLVLKILVIVNEKFD